MRSEALLGRLTRREVLRAAAGGAAWALAGVPGLRCGSDGERREPVEARSRAYFLTDAEVEQMRANVDDSSKPWSRDAFRRTLALADKGLRARPRAPVPSRDYSQAWHADVYTPGLLQGRYVWCQALAHAVTGDDRYAEGAKAFMLEWATTYAWPADEYGPRVGHQVAEPVGFMVKAFLAYDLLRARFSPSERRTFEAWAGLFIPRGMRQADSARDRPWTPTAAVTNGAAWARCLAVVAAAVRGGAALRRTLAWNWSHETEGTANAGEHFEPHGPREYGWPWLIEHAMDSSGKMVEEEYRGSIDYGLYTWQALEIVADVDRHAGDGRLHRFETESGKSLHRVMGYYARYLTERERSPYATASDPDADGPRTFSTAVEAYRAAAERFRNAFPESQVLADIVATGGDGQRGRNFDPHVVGYGAVLGELADA